MITLIGPVLFVAALIVLLAFIGELSAAIVYGLPVKEEILDRFFEKHLDKYKLNSIDNRILMTYSDLLPYIVDRRSGIGAIISSWSFGDIGKDKYGTIPRWSKWHKRLNEYRAEKISASPIKKKVALDELTGD